MKPIKLMILIRFEILPGVLMGLLPVLCPTINFHSQQILDIQNVNSAATLSLSLSLSTLIFQSDNILLTKTRREMPEMFVILSSKLWHSSKDSHSVHYLAAARLHLVTSLAIWLSHYLSISVFASEYFALHHRHYYTDYCLCQPRPAKDEGI